MMSKQREYKFRAISRETYKGAYNYKSFNAGEFIYGNFCMQGNTCPAIQMNIHKDGLPYQPLMCTFPIKLNTLGQYTRIKDKNDVEIYEGDILKTSDNIEIVVWHEEYCAFYLENKRVNSTTCMSYYHNKRGGCEVIGNIYENPELLETIDDE